jgi:Rad3-related DNA helicase
MAEFIMRKGSLAAEAGVVLPSSERALEGTKAHKFLQGKREAEARIGGYIYESEYRLTYTAEFHDDSNPSSEAGGSGAKRFELKLEGRADGVIRKNGGVTIEEIKSTMSDPSSERPADHWHFGQAKVYALMLCEKEKLREATVTVTYIRLGSNETASFCEKYSYGQLKEFFDNLTAEYMKWLKMDYERKAERDKSLKSITFPFGAYRKGQRELAAAVYRAARDKRNLFVQAPTGIGKTISTIFPAAKAIGEGHANRLFYLTAKTTERQAAANAAAAMDAAGARMSWLTITARDKICLSAGSRCDAALCRFADGHFDRVNDALWRLITSDRLISRETLTERAVSHAVCPYALSMEAAAFADAIVCDYNYVFDPKIKLSELVGKDCVLLADEAHNLVDRSREMYSASATRGVFDSPSDETDKKIRAIRRKILKYFDGNSNEFFSGLNAPDCVAKKEKPDGLIEQLGAFADRVNVLMAKPLIISDALREAYFAALDFLSAADLYDAYKSAYTTIIKDGSVKIMCADASAFLSDTLKEVKSAVFFSATLTPMRFFKESLGGGPDDALIRLPSPFDPANLCVVVENRVSTAYRRRAAGYGRVAALLNEMVSRKSGNYFAFFPSYEYLRNARDAFLSEFDSARVISQSRNMDDASRNEFLLNFSERRENRGESLLAFAVMGGVFSEGIDLKGDALIGAAVGGVGLPQLNLERDVIRKYFDEKNGAEKSRGFEYAYMFPGMNKVLQAAGRVVRDPRDKGVILLIDERFASSAYLELFPPEWEHYKLASESGGISAILDEFWNSPPRQEIVAVKAPENRQS